MLGMRIEMATAGSKTQQQHDLAALRHTQYSAWYSQYSKSAFKSAIVDLPEAFCDFLLEDGVSVGDSSRAVRVVLFWFGW